MKFKTLLFATLVTVCFSGEAMALGDLPRPLPDNPSPSQPPPAPTQPQPPIAREPELLKHSFGITPLQGYGVGSYQFVLHPEIGELTEISIHGTEDNVEIREVRIYSSEIYLIRSLNELTGVLSPEQTRVSSLSPASIRRIEVIAAAASFWKRPGQFRLDIVTVKNR